MTLPTHAGTLRTCMRVSSLGGLTRFLLESFITPSLFYSRSMNPVQWNSAVKSCVVDSKGPPAAILEAFERNIRFRTVARRRYFEAQFEVPKLAEERLKNPEFAPEMNVVYSAAFPELRLWKRVNGDEDVRRRELVREAKAAKTGQDLKHWDVADVLEACGCCVYGTSAFNLFCEISGVYDLYTKEYVDGLAGYLKDSGAKTIVEMGAGSGRLTHLLKKHFEDKTHRLIATDSGAWQRMNGLKPVHSVVRTDYVSALEMYNPDTVITSWMPNNQDWTEAFRAHPSVKRYILIGEPDCCGKSWETWGVRPNRSVFDPTISMLSIPPSAQADRWPVDIFEYLSTSSLPEKETAAAGEAGDAALAAPWADDGFRRQELTHLSNFQISRHDRSVKVGNSITLSFVRKDV